MKKILLLALLAPLFVCAQNTNSKAELVGVWQQMGQPEYNRPPMRLPVWKVIQNDGTFCTFLIANQEAQSIITNQGTYSVTSDSTVVEHVTGSITDPDIVGKDNAINFQMRGKDFIHITYRTSAAEQVTHETWVRVKMEVPRQPRQARQAQPQQTEDDEDFE